MSVSVSAGSSVLCQLLLRSVGPCRENVHIILFVPRGHCKCWLLNDVGVCVSFECAGLCVSVCTCPSLFLHVFVSVLDCELVPGSQLVFECDSVSAAFVQNGTLVFIVRDCET